MDHSDAVGEAVRYVDTSFPFCHPLTTQVGDVVYVHVCGQGLVFLNSSEVAFDLLDKRGSVYSDKPYLVMTGEL
jgi:hypothetical protein